MGFGQAGCNTMRIDSPPPRNLANPSIQHGLTDSPYSLRHIARYYREQGFICVAIRLLAHGTRDMGADLLMGPVPGGTARVSGFGRNHTLHL